VTAVDTEPQPSAAVVLAGGGELGIAWENGIAAGLLDEGVDLRRSSLLVGTSAGSVVGARLAAGVDAREIADRIAARAGDPQSADDRPALGPEQQRAIATRFGQLVAGWLRQTGGGSLADLGRFALEASTVPERDFVAAVTKRLQLGDEFPPRLIVTTVDTASGELAAFDASSGAPLAPVVAASCAVPGLFPPVSVDGRRLMDGGARSVTNADLAASAAPSQVLVVTLLPGRAPAGSLFEAWERRLAREVEGLRAGGSEVHVLRADAEDLTAIGPNPMDSSRAPAAVVAGRARGRREAVLAFYDAWRLRT
jgi:NTE family protein